MKLCIAGPVGTLEAELWLPTDGPPKAAIAFCHPHSLHGGSMANTVVFRAGRGLQEAGLAVLRFNFRGVGESAGKHHGSGGIGSEEDDLRAALDHLEQRFQGLTLWAGGFSFGSRTAIGLAPREPRIRRVLLIAVPLCSYPIDELHDLPVPGLFLMAGNDEHGSLADLRARFPALEDRLEMDEIEGVDHFFQGATRELQERVRSWASRHLQLHSTPES